jgi:alpha-tubulin suppressor-like RCC1 family protein
LNDFTLVEDISELYDMNDENQKPLEISQLVCGRRHCMAVFQGGHFYVWGDNEVGQLGNRKRSFMESPFPKRKFAVFHNVENIVAGVDSCGVIVETLPPRKKNPDRKRKQVFS